MSRRFFGSLIVGLGIVAVLVAFARHAGDKDPVVSSRGDEVIAPR